MKRFFLLFIVNCQLSILFLGCASLPDTVEIGQSDKDQVIRQFTEMIARQEQCHCCIDAEASVTFSSVWQKGTLGGYLQAMAPSFLKFVAINPLGQPLAVLVTDGDSFRYVAITEAVVYEGNVDGTTYAKYAPEGFLPEHGFYWLIGRLSPGAIEITDVRLDEQMQGYWVEISYGNGFRSLVLFDDTEAVLLRHIVVNHAGERIFNVLYDNYTDGPCPLPGKIVVTSLIHNSTMELRLSGWLPDVSLSTEDFVYKAPPSFKREVVQ